MRKFESWELERPSVDEFQQQEKSPFAFVLDNVRSAHNIGSIFRTADGFAASGVFLCGITACPPNKEIHKTALGATETVTWEHAKDVLAVVNQLKQENVKVFSVEQTENAIMLDNFNPETNTKYALIFGNEVKGVSQEAINLSDGVIEIPQLGSKHSLNISVSAGIVIWDLFQKMK